MSLFYPVQVDAFEKQNQASHNEEEEPRLDLPQSHWLKVLSLSSVVSVVFKGKDQTLHNWAGIVFYLFIYLFIYLVFLYHEPLAPVCFYRGTDGLASCLLFGAGFYIFFYSDALKVYVLA